MIHSVTRFAGLWQTSGLFVLMGKGPSLDSFAGHGVLGWAMCLNHTATRLGKLKIHHQVERTITHAIDLEVIAEAGEEIERASRYLVMPWMPNREHKRQFATLERLVADFPCLIRMAEEDRLLTYNRLGSPIVRPGLPTCAAKYFSSEAAMDCLGVCGVKSVMTVGIDGGNAYAKAFEDMEPLRNGRASFDDQLPELVRIAEAHAMRVFSFTSLMEPSHV